MSKLCFVKHTGSSSFDQPLCLICAITDLSPVSPKEPAQDFADHGSHSSNHHCHSRVKLARLLSESVFINSKFAGQRAKEDLEEELILNEHEREGGIPSAGEGNAVFDQFEKLDEESFV